MRQASTNAGSHRTLGLIAVSVTVAASLVASAPPSARALATTTTKPTARDYEFRAEFGLTTDPAAVANTVATLGLSPNWGVALTAGEEADLATRVQVEEDLTQLRAALEADPGFAGIRINQAVGGVVEIRSSPEALGRIRDTVATLAPRGARISVIQAANSLGDLQKIKTALRAEVLDDTPVGDAINALRIDLVRNKVVIGIDPARFSATASNLSGRFSDQLVVYEKAVPAREAACTRTSCLPTLRAGLAIGTPHGVCTSNFVAFAGTNYVLLTAGHCGSVGDTVTHAGGTSIGTVTKNAFKNNTYADAMVVDIANSAKSNFVYVTDSVTNRPITSRMPLNGDIVGSAVCGSGIKTLFFCGSVTDLDVDHKSDGGNWVLGMQECTVDVRLGDSGAPMFYGNKAMGIMVLQDLDAGSHVDANGATVWDFSMFNQVRDEEIQLGVTVYTG
jgi:hypothetical protein